MDTILFFVMKQIFIEHQLCVSTVLGNGITRQSIAEIIITHVGSQHGWKQILIK